MNRSTISMLYIEESFNTRELVLFSWPVWVPIIHVYFFVVVCLYPDLFRICDREEPTWNGISCKKDCIRTLYHMFPYSGKQTRSISVTIQKYVHKYHTYKKQCFENLPQHKNPTADFFIYKNIYL
jgi:hypothetical protein